MIRLCKDCGVRMEVRSKGSGRPQIVCSGCAARRHAGRQRERLRQKRATDPVFVELERYALRNRMRRLRNERKNIIGKALAILAKHGGKKRWKGRTKQEKSQHMSMMANARWRRYRKLRKAILAASSSGATL